MNKARARGYGGANQHSAMIVVVNRETDKRRTMGRCSYCDSQGIAHDQCCVTCAPLTSEGTHEPEMDPRQGEHKRLERPLSRRSPD